MIRKWIVVEFSFKIWFYLGSFDWNFVPSPINFLWGNYFVSKSETWIFPFENWRVIKWFHQILTHSKNLDSVFDEIQKSGLKSYSLLFVFKFSIWDRMFCQENETECHSHQKFWFENCFFFFNRKALLRFMIFMKWRKCQLSRFYGVNWHQKLILWNRISNEFCSPKINVFSKIWCFVVFSIQRLREGER